MMQRYVRHAAAALLATGVLLVFRDTLLSLIRHWSASPMYSHAFTVPFISLFILWARRDAFAGHEPRPARVAGAVLTGGALLLVISGDLVAVRVVQQFAFVVAIAGIALYLFGWRSVRVGAPALGYLLFMIPFWDAFTEPLHWPFQQNSAQLGVALLHAVGVPAYREQTIIALPNVTLEVARACSGVNYLIAVLALAVPLAFLRLHAPWRRVTLVVSSLVIAALANGLRVALIGVLSYHEIGSPLHGPFHVLQGLFVAGVGYLAIFTGLYFLERDDDATDTAPAGATGNTFRVERWHARDACVLAIGFWLFVVVGVTPGSTPVALAEPFERIPDKLGAWVAAPAARVNIDSTDPWSDADQRLTRHYQRWDGAAAVVDVRYFEVQRQRREVVNFLVTDLHRRASARRIPLAGGGVLKANLVTAADQRGETLLFWYEVGGTSEADRYAAKLRSVWTVITSGRSNAAAVMVRTAVAAGAEIARLEDLAAQVHQALGRHWPTQ